MEKDYRRIGLEEARTQLGRLVAEVLSTGLPVVLTRRGSGVAVLISLERYTELTALFDDTQ